MIGRHVVTSTVCAALSLALFVGACSTSRQNEILAGSESEQTGWKGAQGASRDRETVAQGRRIAQSQCAGCHSIDMTSVSPNASAPPFRDFAFLNDPDWVAYRLIDGIRLGHQNMPLFDFDVRTTDTLMAYISTLND